MLRVEVKTMMTKAELDLAGIKPGNEVAAVERGSRFVLSYRFESCENGMVRLSYLKGGPYPERVSVEYPCDKISIRPLRQKVSPSSGWQNHRNTEHVSGTDLRVYRMDRPLFPRRIRGTLPWSR